MRPLLFRRSRRALIAIAGALALGAATGAAPAAAISDPGIFVGSGLDRSGGALSINAFTDPNLLAGFEDPNIVVGFEDPGEFASWRPAGALTAIPLRLSCVNITIGSATSSLDASGRSTTTSGFFVIHATDGGLGGPDTFVVRRTTEQPAGFTDPQLRCGARELVGQTIVAGALRAIGDPNIFVGSGALRSGEALSINAFTDPQILVGFQDPQEFAAWRPAGALTAIPLRLSCVNITIGTATSSLDASGRSTMTSGFFVIHATDSGLGGPDTFVVRRTTQQPAGFEDPNERCGARELAGQTIVAGAFRALGNPNPHI